MPGIAHITIGQVFRVPYKGSPQEPDAPLSYLDLTRGSHSHAADLQKGMFYYEQFREPGQRFQRVPAFLFLTNPFKRGAEMTPWVDVVDPDQGYCLFHGDNKKPRAVPLSSRGNARFAEYIPFYSDPDRRKFAPPILVFEQAEHRGIRRGYRRFCGFGVPSRYTLTSQKERSGEYFTNLAVEIVLFRLDRENELFPWSWIDKRRDRTIDADAALVAAPSAWKDWVKHGELAIERSRRFVARQTVVRPPEQKVQTPRESGVLTEVYEYYRHRRHAFEGLASFVSQRVLGPACHRGWVTQRSGDGGVDFVCRLDLGDPANRLSRTSAVVLGQAKCVTPGAEVGGLALARVVARLQRGWIGVFVTTGLFSRAAQIELAEDKYPVVLINGRHLVQVILEVTTQERLSVAELLDRESAWYAGHTLSVPPPRILEDAFSFSAAAMSLGIE
jgi:AspBHI-like restriction endonuclease/restriction endonuclease